MDCPVCKNVALVMADRQGIEIDYCPSCRGVWLDRGELDKLIERSTTSSRGDNRGDREPDSDRYPGNSDPHRKKKKGGLLGELFDF